MTRGIGIPACAFSQFGAQRTGKNDYSTSRRDLLSGTFRESALEIGVAYSMDGGAKASMGVTLADVENDGTQALLVTNLARERRHRFSR
jgi:hypothetical protein